jgi:hypothetical protein
VKREHVCQHEMRNKNFGLDQVALPFSTLFSGRGLYSDVMEVERAFFFVAGVSMIYCLVFFFFSFSFFFFCKFTI